jgi:hypothetical protein
MTSGKTSAPININTTGLSWGTKGIESSYGSKNGTAATLLGQYKDVMARRKAMADKQAEFDHSHDELKRRFDCFRSNLLLVWVLSNIAFAVICVQFVGAEHFLPILYFLVAAFNAIRLLGCLGYLVFYARQFLVFNTLSATGVLHDRHEIRNSDWTFEAVKTPAFVDNAQSCQD